MGILVNTGFDVGSSSPIDNRTVKNTTDERDALVTDGLVYENLKVYCKDTQTEYRWTGTDWEEVGTGGTVDLSEYTKTYTSLTQLGLTAPVSVSEIFNAMPNKTMAVLSCEAKDEAVGTVTVSDIPEPYGVLTIKKNGVGRFSIEYQNSSYNTSCNVKKWIGTLKGADGTELYWKQLSTQTTYTSISELNSAKGTSIELVANTDNTLKIIEALDSTESFITWFNNPTTLNRFGIDTKMYGDKIHKMEIIKATDGNTGMVVAHMKNGQVLNRYYADSVLSAWSISSDAVDIIANTSKYKITLKRRNPNWYGFAKVEFMYDNRIYTINLSVTASEKKPVVKYSVTPTFNIIDSITYDGDVTSETFSIGINLKVTSYGTHKLIIPNGWADIILFAEGEYIGTTTANPAPSVMGYITSPLEIGLTEPTTAMAVYKAMPKYTTFMYGVYNTTSITGLPYANGLLEITKGGGDGTRGTMTFTQSASNSAGYKKKWVGEFKSLNTDTSDGAVIWHQLAFQSDLDGLSQSVNAFQDDLDELTQNNTYSETEQAVGIWINGKTIYRKVIEVGQIDAALTELDVPLCDLGFSSQNIIKFTGIVNSLGNIGLLPYAYNDSYNIISYFSSSKLRIKGTWKYPISAQIIVEYTK